MADFQYQPPADDPITMLRLAMERMDGVCSVCFLHLLIYLQDPISSV